MSSLLSYSLKSQNLLTSFPTPLKSDKKTFSLSKLTHISMSPISCPFIFSKEENSLKSKISQQFNFSQITICFSAIFKHARLPIFKTSSLNPYLLQFSHPFSLPFLIQTPRKSRVYSLPSLLLPYQIS